MVATAFVSSAGVVSCTGFDSYSVASTETSVEILAAEVVATVDLAFEHPDCEYQYEEAEYSAIKNSLLLL